MGLSSITLLVDAHPLPVVAAGNPRSTGRTGELSGAAAAEGTAGYIAPHPSVAAARHDGLGRDPSLCRMSGARASFVRLKRAGRRSRCVQDNTEQPATVCLVNCFDMQQEARPL